MQTVYKALLTTLLIFCSVKIFAQSGAGVLLNEGLELQKASKHTQAIEKFKAALASEPDNAAANYQLAFSLVAEKKGAEAIPFAEKAISTPSTFTAPAYSLLGGIYDASGQAQKAVAAYNAGIKLTPADQNMWFNLGLAYFRNKQYVEAEKAAIEAIKLDVKHANSQRLYALVAFHQNKRLNALIGLCSFLLTDPNSNRAEEAYTNIQSILKGGVLKGADTKNLSPPEAKEANTFNTIIANAINAPSAKRLQGVALTEYQLKSIFTQAGQAVNKKTGKTFFDTFFVMPFYQLAQAGHTEALAQLINKSADGAAYEKWIGSNPEKKIALDNWIKATRRLF
ncbi:tetratricopeptide repeat protein [Mucilaginibacter auburnensis]|uniref:Tetratricopeptide repeat protein n=1 Tax=Mucilaginibacter auburnensis TaxID=1457233 RepID=A0A2H9VRN1_9SPHI|nr:tetratricopeptide repeat protein [Mucilaginibacter auburnensis]PJJ83487.1 tetratricopeptide repeat protein [Mucilaginibacter auburnensis]